MRFKEIQIHPFFEQRKASTNSSSSSSKKKKGKGKGKEGAEAGAEAVAGVPAKCELEPLPPRAAASPDAETKQAEAGAADAAGTANVEAAVQEPDTEAGMQAKEAAAVNAEAGVEVVDCGSPAWWAAVVALRVAPPLLPSLESATDTSNFAKDFTRMPAVDSPTTPHPDYDPWAARAGEGMLGYVASPDPGTRRLGSKCGA